MKKSITLLAALTTLCAVSAVQASDEKLPPPNVSNVFINPLYFYRQNDHLTYVTMVKLNNGSSVERWNTVDCGNKKYYRLYLDILNKDGKLSDRFYGDKSYGRYAPPLEITGNEAKAAAILCDIKVKNSDWVYSEKKNNVGKDIPEASSLVDVANVIKVKDKLLVRLGYGYDEIDYDPPYDAPFDLKVEYHVYDCKTDQDTVIGATDVDPHGFVTDSLIGEAMKKRASDFTNSPAVVESFKTMCRMDEPQRYAGSGKYQSHPHKTVAKYSGPILPDFRDNNPNWIMKFPLTPEVESKGIALIANWAEPRFRQLKWTETQADDKPVKIIADVQANGLVRRLEDYNVFLAQRIMVANDIQLEGAMSISPLPSITQRIETTLRFPLFKGQHYHVLTLTKGQDGEKVTRIERDCDVVSSGDAAKINAAFTGSYWRVECTQSGSDGPEKSAIAWLNDLRIFLPLERTYHGVVKPIAITDVGITR
ncbi:hypothetical protein L579_4289 [Pantoea sp. AS-PWVM4]|uniref:hypothetical protein n=1 Tax=Pantoea sp. AS-PWVM4 TaxID=1332069 RepID=UPI0003AC9A36|nr:hypothetical protein [Pantoea sp. AS-PWVM4]ERK16380.1 hypothetical protein L579_4289 [Pantoea sp. AS-PWVM4]